MTFKSLLLAAIPAAAFATTAGAATISTTLPITTSGQNFSLSESTTAYDPYFGGAGGLLTIVLNGDFTEPTETATFVLDSLGGSLVIGATGLVSNTVNELAFISGSITATMGATDAYGTFLFLLSDLGMVMAMDDGLLTASIDLSSDVDPYADFDSDYITMSLEYDSISLPAVPLPASAPLLLAALAGVGAMKRRKAK